MISEPLWDSLIKGTLGYLGEHALSLFSGSCLILGLKAGEVSSEPPWLLALVLSPRDVPLL